MNRDVRQLRALTGIRFFLAFWVVLYHQIPVSPDLRVAWLPDALPEAFSLILRTGYVAVTAFFVLSGFVLAYNYDLSSAWDKARILRFSTARFSRIYPAYVTGLLMMLPLIAFRATKMPAADMPWLFSSTLLNFLLMQAWWPTTAMTWNYPGWSLSNEAFFYFCFPFVGVWLWRLGSLRAILTTVAGLWLISLLPALYAMWLPIPGFGDRAAASVDHIPTNVEFDANLIRYTPALRLAEFCAGILLARIFRLLPSEHWLFGRGHWVALTGTTALVLLLSHADTLPYAPTHNGLLLPLYMLIIFGLALEGGWLSRWLSLPPLLVLGNASYSMYILHAPLGNWLVLAWRAFTGSFPDGDPLFVTVYAVVVIAVSCAFYLWFEEPVHKWLRCLLSSQRPAPLKMAEVNAQPVSAQK